MPPKYAAKDKLDALEKKGDSTPVLQASGPELPIPRALAGLVVRQTPLSEGGRTIYRCTAQGR